MFKKLFFAMFFLGAAAVLVITVTVVINTGEHNMKAVATETDYQTVTFALDGKPQSELAIWVGPEVIAAYLQDGKSVSLDFTWKQLEQVSLRQRMGDDWKTIKTFPDLTWGMVVRVEIKDDAIRTWFSSQF